MQNTDENNRNALDKKRFTEELNTGAKKNTSRKRSGGLAVFLKGSPYPRWKMNWRAFSMLMACVVVFVTTYSLILPAITMDWDAVKDMSGFDMDDALVAEADDGESAVDYEHADGGLDFEMADAEPMELPPADTEPADSQMGDSQPVIGDNVDELSDGGVIFPVEETVDGESPVAEDASEPVTTLSAAAAGVDVKLTYSEPVPFDAEAFFQEIDRDAYDEYYNSAADEIGRAYPDWSLAEAAFWHVTAAPGSDVEIEMNFTPAVEDEDGQTTFDADIPGTYVFDENGWHVYRVAGLRQGIEDERVVLADRVNGVWQAYPPEQLKIESFDDGVVRITAVSDALVYGELDLGVVVLRENEQPTEIEAADSAEEGGNVTEAESVTEAEGETEAENVTEPENAIEPENTPQSEILPAVAGDYTIPVSGENYVLHVSYGVEAGIPENPEIVAMPVEDEEYAAQAIKEVKSVVEENETSTSAENESEGADTTGDTNANDDTSATDQLKLVGLFDLTIYHDGNVIQPQAPVTVSVEFKDGLAENEQIYAVHFPGTGEQPEAAETSGVPDEAEKTEEITEATGTLADDEALVSIEPTAEDIVCDGTVQAVDVILEETETALFAEPSLTTGMGSIESTISIITPVDTTPEVIIAETSDDTAVFTTEGLSYIAIVSYTVDFHWNVNGKEFTFSIPGGGFISFKELVKILDITDDADSLVADVADLDFSTPALLSVSKAEDNTTVGALKDRLGLLCEYSAELTDEDIEEINATTVTVGDWALISLKAFGSEESLTVTMKNGDVWTIRVTDAKSYSFVFNVNDTKAGAAYAINSNYGPEILGAVQNDGVSSITVRPRSATESTNGRLSATRGFHFVKWVINGIVDYGMGATGDNVNYSDYYSIKPIVGQNYVEDHKQTFTACFAPDNEYLILYTWDNEGGTVSSGTAKSFSYIYPVSPYDLTAQQYYSYSGDGSGLVAVPDDSHVFKGWYDEYNNFVSYDPVCDLSKVTRDCILHPVFGTSYVYNVITNEKDNSAPGYFTVRYLKTNTYNDYTQYYNGTTDQVTFNEQKAYAFYSPIPAHANSGYYFAFWLKDDGTAPVTKDNYELRGTNGASTYNILTRDTTYIAWFTPSNSYIIRLNWPTQGGTSGHLNEQRDPRIVETDCQDFWYYYSSDGVTLTATPADGYVFLGWYDDYNSKTGTGTLISTDEHFYIGNVTKHLNLTPVFEGDVNHRDYYNVWFDGTNGINGMDWTTRNNTLYSRINGNGEVEGAKSVRREVQKTTNTITLPTAAETARPQGYDLTGFTLQGWYDVYKDKYYEPGATVTITADSVFYADWFPENYNIGQAVNVFTPTDTVKYPDTSSFITTSMYDYNSLFNMPSINLRKEEYIGEYEDDDKVKHTYTRQTHINRLGNYEYWEMAGSSTRDFLFISAVSGDVRTLSPIGRKDSLRNQNNETSRDGEYYTGNIAAGIMNTAGLRDDLFDHNDSLGKRYVGDADYLYLYDTETGYYYYDSDKNAASFNKSAKRFYVYDYTNYTDKSVSQGGTDGADFLPFNYGHGRSYTLNGIAHTDFRESYGEPNYWFGMKSSINFFLPNASNFKDGNGHTGNRSIKGDEMVFKFCGDDDVWVYVDDQLYLDLGGIHGKVYGEINFSQGTCTIASSGAKKTVDERGIMSYDASESDPQGSHAGLVSSTPFYLPEGDHTVTIYYLERGSSQSNCAIYFNLAPRYRLNLHKIDNDNSSSLAGAAFGIYSDEACTLAARVWETSTGNLTNIFTTDNTGYLDVSGLIAGHDYYLKELLAPPGYPDISEEVIKLSLGSLGQAAVSSTADAADSGWTMAQVTSSETEGSSNKGTFLLNMTVKNHHQVSITAKKIWAMIDGSSVERDTHSSVTVKLQRRVQSQSGELSSQNHTVRIITRYFADSKNVPASTDSGSSIHTYDVSSHQVAKGGTLSFTVKTGSSAGIYSVVSQYGGITTINLGDYGAEKFFENGGYTTGPRLGSYKLSNIQRNTDIYVTCIGTAKDADALSISVSNVIAAAADGTVYRLIEDDDFNSGNVATNNQPLQVVLSSSNNWQTTWTELESGTGSNTYYYYVKEIESKSSLSDNPLISSIPAYVDTYSSDGLSGGTITVRNTLQAQKFRLRKRDENKNYLGGAEFEIYLESEYQGGNGQPLTLGTNASVWLDDTNCYDAAKNVFVSQEGNGKFYSGYLPLGTYYIVEKKAPSNYKRLEGAIKIVVDEEGLQYQYPGETSMKRKKVGSDGYYALYIDDSPLVPVDVTIYKVARGTSTPLTGAVFTLTKVDAENHTILDKDSRPEYSVTQTVNAEGADIGKTTFTGLTYARYRLEETTVPDGYVKTEGAYYFEVDENGNHALMTNGCKLITQNGNTYTIENEPGVALPVTGGPGTKLIYLFGGLLTAMAGILLAARGRKPS